LLSSLLAGLGAAEVSAAGGVAPGSTGATAEATALIARLTIPGFFGAAFRLAIFFGAGFLSAFLPDFLAVFFAVFRAARDLRAPFLADVLRDFLAAFFADFLVAFFADFLVAFLAIEFLHRFCLMRPTFIACLPQLFIAHSQVIPYRDSQSVKMQGGDLADFSASDRRLLTARDGGDRELRNARADSVSALPPSQRDAENDA
jgi:hypothetical protein